MCISTDESDATALIAVQGPNSEAIILRALDESGSWRIRSAHRGGRPGEGRGHRRCRRGQPPRRRNDTVTIGETVRELKYYAWMPLTIAGIDLMLARTGYTGEDGFELYTPNIGATRLWETRW
jgi:aminomethyltransferase